MKRFLPLGLVVFTACAGGNAKVDTSKKEDRISYAIGMDVGRNLKNQNIDVKADMLGQGIKDAFAGGKLQMTDEQFKETMMSFQKEMMAKHQADQAGGKKNDPAAAEAAKSNEADGLRFLAKNAKESGVKVTASGLQYKVLKEGKGKTPKATDTVKVHYKGTLIDGTVFDSSIDRGEPAVFPVNGVIPGWTEALQLMKEGAKWQLTIPPNLAYGPNGAGDKIGPNSVLVFEVELIKVQ